MAFAKLIAFDRPMTGVSAPGLVGRTFTEEEMARATEAAYRRGIDDSRAMADQQMVEFRADVEQLHDGVLKRLPDLEPMLVRQIREALPGLAIEIARRLLAGYEPSPEVVSRLCEEALTALFPERENLELVVSQHDSEVLTKLNPAWLERYPGLKVCVDSRLKAGDCQVRSRFGLTDARQEIKLNALASSLTAA
jgi:flagellar assembly protein FliH